jgi:hypothetical protein
MGKSIWPDTRWLLAGTLCMAISILVACEGPAGPAGLSGPEGPSGAMGCAGCHNAQTTLAVKTMEYEQSKHWWGGNHVRGSSPACAGCHASEGFTTRVEAGLQPDEVTAGVTTPTPIRCRTCHQIHETHTPDDWALRVQGPVILMASGATFDRGAGNLCASCHQPRAAPPERGGGDVEITSPRWDAHRTQAAVLLGLGGYGPSSGPGIHYMAIQDACVTCHMGPSRVHTKDAQLPGCQTCHEGLGSFDRNSVQTQVNALFDELEELLLANGILRPNGQAEPGTYAEEVAGAFWNYKFVYYDRSSGVHNPGYIKELLQSSIDALK